MPPNVGVGCELGFGQGVSVNVHAAASNVEWWGSDFNPAQAAFAQETAASAGAKAHLTDEAFAEFCARPDLPQMDFVGLHGIWSWISDENRSVIVDFLRRKLKVGGVLYVSYNTQPGWAAMVPVRDLFVEHEAVVGSAGEGRVARVEAALAFADKLMAVNPAFARANPQIADRLKRLGSLNRNYVAHEYFNRDWQPMSFARMARWLEPAKLTFASSANCLDPVDAINLSPEQQTFLAGIADREFRHTVRDFCVNQAFRKDYWVKGARTMTSAEQLDALRRQSIVLVTPVAEFNFKAPGGQGDVGLNEDIYKPMLEQLSDHRPHTLAELETVLAPRKITIGQVVQAAMILRGKNVAFAAQDAEAVEQAQATSDRLNRHLKRCNAMGKDLAFLSSPVTGGAVSVARIHQLFMLSMAEGKTKPEEWARDAWALMSAQGQKMMKNDKILETTEENIADLTANALDFHTERLPMYRALKVL